MSNSESKTPEWYVIHTYTDYENKVKNAIEAAVDNRNMGDKILEVRVPTRKETEIKNGRPITTEAKLYPGYVIVYMYMSDEAWYIIRNTRGVTGFVGPEAKPIPLKEEELINMGILSDGCEEEFEVGDEILVVDGPLEGFSGVIEDVASTLGKIHAILNIFGQSTQTELKFNQIQKVESKELDQEKTLLDEADSKATVDETNETITESLTEEQETEPTPEMESTETETVEAAQEEPPAEKDTNFLVDDRIRVVEGPLEDLEGTIIKVYPEESRVKANLMMFGRETPTDLDYSQIEKIKNEET